MPIVRIEMWAGRPPEFKASLAKEITEVVARRVGCEPRAVTVIVDEIPKENWAIGGVPCTELFKGVV